MGSNLVALLSGRPCPRGRVSSRILFESIAASPMKLAQAPISEEVARAARNLVASHGRNAARVAGQRAANAALGGSGGAADQWRQIAKAIDAMQNG